MEPEDVSEPKLFTFIYGGLTNPTTLREFAVRNVDYVPCYLLHYELAWNIAVQNHENIINPFSYHGRYVFEESGEAVDGAIAFVNVAPRRYAAAPGLLYAINTHDLDRLSWRSEGMYERFDVTAAVLFPAGVTPPDMRDAVVYAFRGQLQAETVFEKAQTLYVTRQYIKKLQDAFVFHGWTLPPCPAHARLIDVSWKKPIGTVKPGSRP